MFYFYICVLNVTWYLRYLKFFKIQSEFENFSVFISAEFIKLQLHCDTYEEHFLGPLCKQMDFNPKCD